MEISWKFHGEIVEKMWRFCVRSIVVEKMWRNHRESMEVLWKFHGENPRLECGETVEHLWRIANVEHLCGINTLENRRLENIKTRYNGVVREISWKD